MLGVVLGEWDYYFIDPVLEDGEPYQVSESYFDDVIIKYRDLFTMHYDKDDINRQNFYDVNGNLVAFRIKRKIRGIVCDVG